MMINEAKPKYLSLIMSAIDYRKTQNLEPLNSKQINPLEKVSISSNVDFLQKHPLYKNIHI